MEKAGIKGLRSYGCVAEIVQIVEIGVGLDFGFVGAGRKHVGFDYGYDYYYKEDYCPG